MRTGKRAGDRSPDRSRQLPSTVSGEKVYLGSDSIGVEGANGHLIDEGGRVNQRTAKQRELNNVLAPVRAASVVDSAKLSHEGQMK